MIDAYSVLFAVYTRNYRKAGSRFSAGSTTSSQVTSEPPPRVLIKFPLLLTDISDWILTF